MEIKMNNSNNHDYTHKRLAVDCIYSVTSRIDQAKIIHAPSRLVNVKWRVGTLSRQFPFDIRRFIADWDWLSVGLKQLAILQVWSRFTWQEAQDLVAYLLNEHGLQACVKELELPRSVEGINPDYFPYLLFKRRGYNLAFEGIGDFIPYIPPEWEQDYPRPNFRYEALARDDDIPYAEDYEACNDEPRDPDTIYRMELELMIKIANAEAPPVTREHEFWELAPKAYGLSTDCERRNRSCDQDPAQNLDFGSADSHGTIVDRGEICLRNYGERAVFTYPRYKRSSNYCLTRA